MRAWGNEPQSFASSEVLVRCAGAAFPNVKTKERRPSRGIRGRGLEKCGYLISLAAVDFNLFLSWVNFELY
jgi:hypothetical protein